ncbi:hypothetical protein OLP40_06835 [Campylobacter jejuni]|nr:hypothetical protein C414_000040084 [Campylobacter jejuni subsp. jejuni 414]MCW1333903.1 hypothetical protein [Campylobacter jejuni]MCW1354839.1 hypothetical protein [Campylobacter jejuni]MCW1358875.1 hypothetical protein [Campylobacter jejuni]MCW1686480.1 hypothetical protein [Campylobacter jejuni]
MSENTLNRGIKRLSFSEEMVFYDFRTTISTLLHEFKATYA